MQQLLSQLQHETGIAPYVSRLLEAFGGQPAHDKRVTMPTAATTYPLSLGTFSDRELEILRLIQEGHSNQNIGERLFLSLSTVKWHNQNIFFQAGRPATDRGGCTRSAIEIALIARSIAAGTKTILWYGY